MIGYLTPKDGPVFEGLEVFFPREPRVPTLLITLSHLVSYHKCLLPVQVELLDQPNKAFAKPFLTKVGVPGLVLLVQRL